ncbi:hypothetical protein BIV57_10165 [Mangrovactinospora gilvigrisea]|uniref:L,D-TPase catalytic domain-containing protein n=1 Tax=Mangrovactinospora gilvigrisea TaxID=1428644 RepID=A0A1J7BG37_9ACTN|nr:hypothetical protein BIV57_10165 [Mangrovactinospora gilvigrisea]
MVAVVGAVRGAVALGTAAVLAMGLSGCGGRANGQADAAPPHASPSADVTQLPGVGPGMRSRIPADARQVVLVTGADVDSIDSDVGLWERRGARWHLVDWWQGHNGKKGWTPHHTYGDYRTPIGVFTVHDAGGVLPNPGTRLTYQQAASYQPPKWWGKGTEHIFDYTIAIDYNRVIGSPPSDQRKPQGAKRGGNIWLHMDDGRGTAACVSQSREKMLELLRVLDPAKHPVVVMGDAAHLAA